MSWLLFSTLAAFFDSFKNLYAKKLTKQFDEYLLAFATSFIVVIFLSPVVFFEFPVLGDKFFYSLIITALINSITLILILKAIKSTEISLIVPLFSLSPAFLLVTSPFISGEFPSFFGLIGIFFILSGVYALNFKGKASLAPIKEILKNKGQRLIVIVSILWAISSNYYKIGMESSSPIFFIFSLNFVIVFLLFPLVLKKSKVTKLKKNWHKIVPLGILSALTSIFQWVSVSMTLAVYALSVKRLSILFTVVGGIIFFKEEKSYQKIIATIMVLVGIYFIVI